MAGSSSCRHAAVVGLLLLGSLSGAWAQDMAEGRLLIRGAALEVAPARQEVDPGRPTVVNTTLGGLAPGALPAGFRAVGELSGPGLDSPVTLSTVPGQPFRIPGLMREGRYLLSGIRLEDRGTVLAAGDPDVVEIVVHRLVIASVTSRPLTPEEMAAAGIVIDEDSYTVWRYSVGFATESGTYEIPFDLVSGPDGLTLLPSADPYRLPSPDSPPPPAQPQVQMVDIEIPSGGLPDAGGGGLQESPPPSVPGFLIIPGDVAFLHQFFSAILVVQNGALADSGIELRNLHAVLEPGDEGIRQAETEPPTVQGEPVPVVDPGPDGTPGTSDDLTFIVAQASGQASWAVEGLAEGQHLLHVHLAGQIAGLAGGEPVSFEASVPGVVVVRDPRFALTFVHPWTVRAGELYELKVVVSNTSAVSVYDLHMTLPSNELSGAQLADPGSSDQIIDELPPGGSATVTWSLVSLKTGRVVASAFNTSSGMTASFRFHAGVGELGIPLSPESLVLPPDVDLLPEAVTRPAIELLGLAHSLANAPPGAELSLPPVSEGMVVRRGQELAAAARRASLGEAVDRCLLDVGIQWLGSATWDAGWDALRRASRRGGELEEQLAAALERRIEAVGRDAAMEELAELALSGRPFLVVTARNAGYGRAARLLLSGGMTQTAAAGQAADTAFHLRDLPGAAVLDVDTAEFSGEVGLVAVPLAEDGGWAEGSYQVQLLGMAPGSVQVEAVMVMPDGSTRSVQPAAIGTAAGSLAFFNLDPDADAVQVFVDANGDTIQDGGETVPVDTSPAPAPRLLLARFDDTLQPPDGGPYRSVILLFSQMVDTEALGALDPAEWVVASHLELPADGEPLVVDRDRVGEALVQQIDPHVLVVAVSSPLNPHADLTLSSGATSVPFLGGRELALQDEPVATGGNLASGAVRGVVIGPDGSVVPGASVELYERVLVDDPIDGPTWLPARADSVTADVRGRFVFDAVRARTNQVDDRYGAFLLRAVDPGSGHEARLTARLEGDAAVRDITVAMVGRGDVVGRLSREDGRPLVQPEIRARSAVYPEEGAAAVIDADGSFLLPDLPVGPVQIAARDGDAVTYATGYVPGPGQQATVNLVLPAGPPAPRAGIEGQVVSGVDGTGARGLQVYLVPDGQVGAVAVETTGVDGSFAMPDVPAGMAWLKVYDPARRLYVGQAQVELLADTVNRVQILVEEPQTASIEGTVYRTVSGARVPAENVFVVAASAGSSTTTDDAGRFRLDELPLGSVELRAMDPQTGDTAQVSLTLTAPGQVLSVELDLSSSEGVIQGTVVDRDGVPVPGARVAVGRFGGGLETTTDGSGEFVVGGVQPGTHEVLAASSDGSRFGRSQATVLYDGDTADVVVAMGGTVDLQVVTVADTTGGGTAEVLSQFSYRMMGITSEGKLGLVPEDEWYTCGQNATCSIDASGRADFWGLPEGVGPVVVRAENPFYGSRSVSEDLDPSDQGRVLTINFSAPGSLAGRVVARDGEGLVPVAGATVQLWIKDDRGAWVAQQAVTTEADGRFLFELVMPGGFRVTAYDPQAGTPGWIEGRVGSAQVVQDLEVLLRPLGSVTGVVELCSRGDAPSGRGDEVHLRLVPDGSGQPLLDGFVPPALATHEDDVDISTDGTFVFTGLAAGRWSLLAESPLHGTAVVPVTVPDEGGEVTLEGPVCLAPAGSLAGTVVDPATGSPVPDAMVQLWVDTVPPFVADADVSGPDGTFRFSPIPVGKRYYVAAFEPATNRGGASARVRLCSPGDPEFGEECVQDAELQVPLQPPGSVRGTVTTADGDPVAGAFVRLRAQMVADQGGDIGTSPVELVAFSDAAGTFSFEGVPAGVVQVAAFAPDSPLWNETEAVVDPVNLPVTQADMALPATAPVTVRVLDPDGAALADDSAVVAYRQLSTHYREPSDGGGRVEGLLQGAATTFTAVEGDFEVGVCHGACAGAGVDDVLFHRLGGILAAYAHPTMPEPPQSRVVDLRLVGRAGLVVQVWDGEGQPAGDAQVMVSGSGFYGSVTLGGQTGPDGVAGPFEGLGVGEYTVSATRTDVAGNTIRGTSTVVIQQEDHGRTLTTEVSLESAGSASGQVVMEDGTPAEGALVTMSFTEGTEVRRFQAVSTTGGGVSFPALPGGHTYELEAVEGGGGRGLYRAHGIPVGTDPVDLGTLRLDSHNPAVAQTSPASGAQDVDPTLPIVVEFSEPMRHDILDPLHVRLRRGGDTVAATLSVEDLPDPDGEGPRGPFTRVTLDHADLQSDSLYVLDVVQGVEDLSGRTLTMDFHASFRTADTVPPSVVAVEPADDPQGARPVGPDEEPRITFSETIDPASIDGTTVRLVDASGADVTAQRVVESDGFAVRLRPDSALALDTFYTITVSGVRDTSGNAMAAPWTSTFRVRDAEPPVVTLLPPDGVAVTGDTWTAVEGAALLLRAAVVSNDALASFAFSVDGAPVPGTPTLDQASGEYRQAWTVPTGAGQHVLAAQAADVSGNLSAAVEHPVVVTDDAPPTGTLTADPATEILPNHLLHLTIDGQDDHGLVAAHLTLSGAITGTRDLSFSPGTTGQVATSFRVPAGAAAGAQVVVDCTIEDSFGQVTPLAPATLTVLADSEPPVVTTVSPPPGATVTSGDTLSFTFDLADNVAGATVTLHIDGRPQTVQLTNVIDPGSRWTARATASWRAPEVTEPTDEPYTLTVSDPAGNTTTESGTFTVQPLVNPDAPVVTIECPSTGDPVLPDTSITVSFHVTDDEQIQKYTIFAGGTPVLADVAVDAAELTATYDWTPPATADPGDSFVIRIEAGDYAGNTGMDQVTLTVPAGTVVLTGDQTIADPHAGETLVLGPGTYTFAPSLEELTPDSLILVQGATLRTEALHPLAITTAGETHVACGAVLDASGFGYGGGTGGHPAGYAPEGVVASLSDAGGSHGGEGTIGDDAGPQGEAYGSVYEPGLGGGGGAAQRGDPSARGRAGGGVIVVDAGELVLEGEIRADGDDAENREGTCGAGGAGGAVVVRAGVLRGGGVVSARGGYSSWCWINGAGGGGRVALDVGMLDGFDPGAQVDVAGGVEGDDGHNPREYGGAGTVYVRTAGSTYGDLIVDQGGTNGKPVGLTPLPSIGRGTIGAVTEDGSDAWMTPSSADPDFDLGVVGMWVRIEGTDYRVMAQQDRRTILLEGAAGALAAGQAYQGVYTFDSVAVHGGARVLLADPLDCQATDVDGASLLVRYNHGGPEIDPGKVDISAHDGGFWVEGEPGAVTDADGIESAQVLDETSGAGVGVDVAGDGSFPAVRIPGSAGDVIELRATDAHLLPESSAADLGSLPGNSGPPTVDSGLVELTPAAPGTWELSGSPGTVADNEPPVTVTLTNTGTQRTWVAVAGPDGAFSMTISGTAGDLLRLTATDGHPQPAQTAVDLGPLPGNEPPVIEPSGLSAVYVGPSGEEDAHYEVRVAAGAVTDGDPPILIRVTDPATGGFAGPVSVDSGSAVSISLEGMDVGPGDVLALTATDSHPASPATATVELPPLPPDNYGPPEVDTSRVRVLPMGFGVVVLGEAGAVTDPDGPSSLMLRDTASGWTSGWFAVEGDGAFLRRIPGDPGAVLTLEAVDAHPDGPLSTGELDLGPLPSPGVRWDTVPTEAAGAGPVATVTGRLLMLDGGSALARADLRTRPDEDWAEGVRDVVTGIAPSVTAVMAPGAQGGGIVGYALSGGDVLVWLRDDGCGDGPCWPAEVRPVTVSTGTLQAGRAVGGWLYLAGEDPGGVGLTLRTLAEPSVVEDWDNGTRSVQWPCDGSVGYVPLDLPEGVSALAVIPGPPGRVAVVVDDPAGELLLVDVTDPLAPGALGGLDLPGGTTPAWAAWDDGQLCLVRNDGSVEVWRWNGPTMEAVATWQADGEVTGAVLTGSQFWLGLADGRIQQVDLRAHEGPALRGGTSLGTGAVRLADLGNSVLAAVDGELLHVWAWDLPPDLEPGQVAWQADGEYATVRVDVDRYVEDCGESQSTVRVQWPDGPVETASFAPYDHVAGVVLPTDVQEPPQVSVTSCSGLPGSSFTPADWFPWDVPALSSDLRPAATSPSEWVPTSCAADLVALGQAWGSQWTLSAHRGDTEVVLSRWDDATSGVLHTQLPVQGGVAGIVVSGTEAWVPAEGLEAWDLADPAAPNLLRSLDLLGSDPVAAAARGELFDWDSDTTVTWIFAVGGTPARLAAVNIDEPSNPVVAVDGVPLPAAAGSPVAAAWAADSLIVLTRETGVSHLLRYGLTDPSAPVLLASADIPNSPLVTHMDAGTVSMGEGGTIPLAALVRDDATVELLDAGSMASFGTVSLPVDPLAVAVPESSGRAYVALGNGFGLAAVWADPYGGGLRVRFGLGDAAAVSSPEGDTLEVVTTAGKTWTAGAGPAGTGE